MLEKYLSVKQSTPSISAGVAAGSSPTISITGNDTTGTIDLVPGNTTTSVALLATITFGVVYTSSVRVTFTPRGVDSFNSGVVISSESTTGFVLSSNITPLTTGTSYKWNYLVVPIN